MKYLRWLKPYWLELLLGFTVALVLFVAFVLPALAYTNTQIKSDAHVENMTCDGYIYKKYSSEYWAYNSFSWFSNAASGTTAYDSSSEMWVGFRAAIQSGKYYYFYRSFASVDLTPVIDDKNIASANYTIKVGQWDHSSGGDEPSFQPSVCLYTALPSTSTALVPADWDMYGSVPISNPVSHSLHDDDWASQTLTFEFNEYGLSLLNRALVANDNLFQFAILYTCDAINEPIVWGNWGEYVLKFRSVEYTGTTSDPYLSLNYDTGEPSQEQIETTFTAGDGYAGGDGGGGDTPSIPGIGDIGPSVKGLLGLFGMNNSRGYWLFLFIVEVLTIIGTLKSPKWIRVMMPLVVIGLFLSFNMLETWIVVFLGIVCAVGVFAFWRTSITGYRG